MDCLCEEWRPVPGWEGLYSVSSHGRVRSEARITRRRDGITKTVPERILRPGKTLRGYAQVNLKKPGFNRVVMISHLVAEAFLGPRPHGQIVRHGPAGRQNDHASNLSYGTYRENNGPDKRRDGTAQIGEKNPMSKLTEDAVRFIRESSDSTRALADRYRVSLGTIRLARSRKTWAYMT